MNRITRLRYLFWRLESRLSKCLLVTGAAGFIGSHVSQALLERGDSVVGLDNLSDYYDPGRKHANIRELRRSDSRLSRFQFVVGDVRDLKLLARLFMTTRFDVIIHSGAVAGVRASIEDPQQYFDVNLNGTLNLLEAARTHQTPHFVLASTSSVYGKTGRIPFVETGACDRPLGSCQFSDGGAPELWFFRQSLLGPRKMW
jgi:UDP-glucuronate 4-epimerase